MSEIRVLRDLENTKVIEQQSCPKKMRDRLKTYFNNEDAVSWQYEATFGTSRE